MWTDLLWAWLQPSVEAYINCHDRNKWCAKHAINICITAWLKWSSIVTKSSLTRPVASFSTFQTMPFGSAVSFVTAQRKWKSCTLHNAKSLQLASFSLRSNETGSKSHFIIMFVQTLPFRAFLFFCQMPFSIWQVFADLQRWMKLANSRLVLLKQCVSNNFA